jgi:hypothetical protein
MTESKGAIGNVSGNSPLVEMAMGYARSRALSAAARLGIADHIGDASATVDELARACAANPDALGRLLRGLASFGIVSEIEPGRFVLTSLGAPLQKKAPGSVWAAVVFWADLLADSWAHLTECVRTGDNAMAIMGREGMASRWAKDPDAHAIFRAVMGTGPADNYAAFARAWDFSKQHIVADLGGGGGALIVAILNAYANLGGMLVDFPSSIEDATARVAAEGLSSRCRLVAADLREAVPAGADVYMLKHVLHGYPDEGAIGVLKNCRAVIPGGGRLLVIEFVLPDVIDRVDKGLEERVMSDLNMLVVTGGKERSASQWQALLARAGFAVGGVAAVPGESASIIEAVPV